MSFDERITVVKSSDPTPAGIGSLYQQIVAATPSGSVVGAKIRALENAFGSSLQEALPDVAVILREAFRTEDHSEELSSILEAFANAARDSKWRASLGPALLRDLPAANANNCLLGVAIDVLYSECLDSGLLRQALRLIANCCVDENVNRAFVIQKHGLERMVLLLSQAREPNFMLGAVNNICLDFEMPPSSMTSSEMDDSTSLQINAAQRALAHAKGSAGECSFDVLLWASRNVDDEFRSIAVGLIEMASYAAHTDTSFLARASEDDSPPSEETLARVVSSILTLPQQDGQELAAQESESCVSVCNAITNLMKQQQIRLVTISRKLVYAVMNQPYLFDETQLDPDDDDTSAVLEDLSTCRRLYIKVLYALSEEPSFASVHQLDDVQVTNIVALFSQVLQEPLDKCRPSPAYAGLLVANMINSVSRAEIFVQSYSVHKPVHHILLEGDDPDLLFVTLGLLNKLCLAEINRSSLLEQGMIGALRRVLALTSTTDVQREAAVAARLLIKGQPATLDIIRQEVTAGEDTVGGLSLPMQLVQLFDRSNDGATKSEVGRFVVEVCRSQSKLEQQPSPFLAAFGSKQTKAVEAVVFLAQHGQGSGKSEGWFGLALISTRESSASLVLSVIRSHAITKDLELIATAKQGPDFDNASLMLAKLLSYPATAVVSSDALAELHRLAPLFHLSLQPN